MPNGRKTLAKTKFLSRLALSGFCFFAGLLGTSQTTFAVNSTLTITLSGSAVTANIAPTTTPSGTFIQSSDMTVGVSTNHFTGYTLSIKANDATTPDRLKNGSSYLQSIATPTTLNNFKNADLSATNLTTSLGLSDCAQITESSNCKGIWGYKPNYLYNATMDTTDANDLFLPTPGTAGQAIAKTSGPNQTPNEYTITLGTKVSPLATVGSYTNVFVLMAVGNSIPYTIEYDENNIENMPANIIDGSASGTTVTIPSGVANTPARPGSGYKFAGWCDQPTTKSGGDDVCASGHSHQPGDAISLSQTGVNGIKLYAIWEESTIANSATMQEVASCPSSLPTGQIYTIKDSRDNQDYKVAKLADGRCWMVENLNLAGGTALSADDTDVTSDYISDYYAGSSRLAKSGNTLVLPASSTTGFNTDNYSYVYNSGNKTNCGASDQNVPCYSYYSWDAATLGSGRSISTDNTDAEQSICPKGWRLPTSGSSSSDGWKRGDFYALATAYGANLESNYYENSATFYNNAGPGSIPNLLLAGYYRRNSFYNGGSTGYYWSSTVTTKGDTTAYHFDFNSSKVNSSANNYTILNRYIGLSVRCLFSL